MTFLTLFLKVLNLKGKVASTLGGNWFQLFMVLFTKEYLPTSVVLTCVMLCQYWFNFHCHEGRFLKLEISLLVRRWEITQKVCKWKGDAVGFMG
jgi:hypothetical protein